MLSRRELVAAGVAAATVGGGSADAVPSNETQDRDAEALRLIARAVSGVESSIERGYAANSLAHGYVGKIRAAMEQFFRANARFPDFFDIGIGVFYDVYDWHIKNQHQLVVTRGPDGRYWMQFMFTTLVLRHEVEPNHLGIPYDRV